MVKISKSLKSSFVLLMSFLILQGFTGCKDGGDGFGILEENLAFINDPEQPTGNVGITFDDGKYDFGVAEAYETTTNLPVTLTNGSGKNLYFGGLDFGDANQHFSVISTKCPESPSIFPADFSCEMIVAFSPQAPEQIVTLMAAQYGEEVDSIELKTEVFAQGRGVSSIDFDGITDIDNATTTAMDIFWDSNPDIVNFNVMIALGQSPDDNDFSFKKSVPNTGGGVNYTNVDGLTPGTFYSFKVNAVDILGNTVVSENFKTQKTLPNNAPSIASGNFFNRSEFFTGKSYSIDVKDDNTGGTTDVDGDPLTFSCRFSLDADSTSYTFPEKPTCKNILNENGTTANFNEFTGRLTSWIPHPDWAGRQMTFYFTAKDPYGLESTFDVTVDITQGKPSDPVVKYRCLANTVVDRTNFSSVPSCDEVGDSNRLHQKQNSKIFRW